MDGYHHFHDQGGHPLAWVFFVLLLIAVAALVVIAARALLAGRSGPATVGAAPSATPRGDDALAIVRTRYARGEIGRDDFLRLNEDLGGPPDTTLERSPPGA